MTDALKCPICQRDVGGESSAIPFCSSQCKAEDLCNWLDGTYVGDEEDEGLET
jgi:endogenous inhibitor of DNA gyrase (YacG/DUF329 family)